MIEKFKASMILGNVGDSMGYKNGQWEFCYDTSRIHKELESLGGVEKLHLNGREWMVSDDTVMHLATARGLVKKENTFEKEMRNVAIEYVHCWNDMSGRAPGGTCRMGVEKLGSGEVWDNLEFNPRGGGCGAAMRSSCIGLRYKDTWDIIKAGVETGRMTHHHPSGYMGAVVGGLFTRFALDNIPIKSWGKKFFYEIIPQTKEYLATTTNRYVKENLKGFDYAEKTWKTYLEHLENLPENYETNHKIRDNFYKYISFRNRSWPGSNGIDASLIAYDCLIGSKGDWTTLCKWFLNGGDSDSIGILASSWFGTIYGFEKIPEINYQDVEYRLEAENLAIKLFEISNEN